MPIARRLAAAGSLHRCRSRSGWRPAQRAALRVLRLERHVLDPLAQIGALALHLVLRLVDPSAKLAHLLLERVHPRQQLRDEIAAAGRRRWIAAATEIGRAAASPSRLILQRLHLAAQIQDLVLQRDPFTALHLRAGRLARTRHQNKQHKCRTRGALAERWSFCLSSRAPHGGAPERSHDARHGQPCGRHRTSKTGDLGAAGSRTGPRGRRPARISGPR